MRVLLHTEFAASKREPLAEMFDRVYNAFIQAGLGEPQIRFSFGDAPLDGYVSSVDRVLKRLPEMRRFLVEASAQQGMPLAIPAARRLTNQGSADFVDLSTLREIAAGVPRSFPFHTVSFVLAAPALGEGSYKSLLGDLTPGVSLGDSWWVSGRTRALSSFVFVEAEVTSKNLPPLPESVAALFAALGKARKTTQFPLPGENPAIAQAAKPEILQAVADVVTQYRERIPAMLEQIPFPHDLPPVQEALRSTPLGQMTGSKKPALVRAFKPMGYDCKGESGVFTLRRRTAANLTLEISLDVGTWSRSLTANFAVHGLGVRAPMRVHVSRHAGLGQYPIGDGERWQKIVENLAAFVAELEKSFVPAVEAAAGPSPEWYTPEK